MSLVFVRDLWQNYIKHTLINRSIEQSIYVLSFAGLME